MAEPRHKYVKLESLAGGDRYVVGDTVQSRFTENGIPKWFRGQITEVLLPYPTQVKHAGRSHNHRPTPYYNHLTTPTHNHRCYRKAPGSW